jgi:hypothetical protein
MRIKTLLAALVALAALVLPAAALAVAPGATTGPATNVGSTTATLTGTVNPNKEQTTYRFEYGTDTAYGLTTPTASAGKGNAGRNVTANLTSLAPSTTYHYRLVATNPDGTTPGADMTFTTLAAGQGPGGANALTIAATPALTFGRSTNIGGQLTGEDNGGKEVTLMGQPLAGGTFADVATTTTDAAGNYNFVVTPLANTRYQAEAKASPPVTSPTVDVRVRIAVTRRVSDRTVRRGQVVRFRGTAKPAHDGSLVLIQRRGANRKYRTVARTRLRKSTTAGQSTYAKRVRVRRGVYRVRVPGDADHLRGTSRPIRLKAAG